MSSLSKSQEKDKLITNTSNDYKSTEIEKNMINNSDTTENGSTLIIAFFFMLLFQLGNRIFSRLQTYPMHNYPIFLNIMSCFIYIPICFLYIIPMITYGNKITKEQRQIPQYKFAIMGMWDSVAGIMQTFAVNYISNSSTIVLVQQAAIPISMLISKITLQARYSYSQYAGAFVVLLGIVIVLIPTFLNSNKSNDSTGNSMELIWIVVLVLSCIPMCLSSVYKEKALGEVEIDVVYLNGCVAVFQFLFAIPLCIPSAQVINIPVSQIIPNIFGGLLCWGGINSYSDDDCRNAPFFVTTYLLFNIGYNILIVVILKHGSANILWMASTVIVPLSNVAFSLKFMPGHQPLHLLDLVGLFVIMFGLLLYRFYTQIVNLYMKMQGKIETIEEIEEQKKVTKIGKKVQSKQTKYVGINQIESIQSIIDTRIYKEQREELHRTSQQIRENLLVKLGIPPSPYISLQTRRPSLIKNTNVNPNRTIYSRSPVESRLLRNGYNPIASSEV